MTLKYSDMLVVMLLSAILIGLWLYPNPQANASSIGEASLPTDDYLWIDKSRLLTLPIDNNPAWQQLKRVAQQPVGSPNLADQDDKTNTQVFAKALVYARLKDEPPARQSRIVEKKFTQQLRQEVIATCMNIIGTQAGSRSLETSKELMAYILAADLVGFGSQEMLNSMTPSEKTQEVKDHSRFVTFLKEMQIYVFKQGKTITSTHERRPNNWGTYAGATRIALSAYLAKNLGPDSEHGARALSDISRAAKVFNAWLGGQETHPAFRFKNDSWQANPEEPLGINPVGSSIQGHSVDGVLPDDQRRGGSFSWPPVKENYVYSALQGAVSQAVLLDRLGFNQSCYSPGDTYAYQQGGCVWEWGDSALFRAFHWLNVHANFPASGDDTWLPHIINLHYPCNDISADNTDTCYRGIGVTYSPKRNQPAVKRGHINILSPRQFDAPEASRPGKNIGWSGWTHLPEESSTP